MEIDSGKKIKDIMNFDLDVDFSQGEDEIDVPRDFEFGMPDYELSPEFKNKKQGKRR